MEDKLLALGQGIGARRVGYSSPQFINATVCAFAPASVYAYASVVVTVTVYQLEGVNK